MVQSGSREVGHYASRSKIRILSRVDEIGFVVSLMPSGGKGFAGWSNVSVVELYAKPVPRESASGKTAEPVVI